MSLTMKLSGNEMRSCNWCIQITLVVHVHKKLILVMDLVCVYLNCLIQVYCNGLLFRCPRRRIWGPFDGRTYTLHNSCESVFLRIGSWWTTWVKAVKLKWSDPRGYVRHINAWKRSNGDWNAVINEVSLHKVVPNWSWITISNDYRIEILGVMTGSSLISVVK